MTRLTALLLSFSIPVPLSAIDSVVTFNELQYHPPGPNQTGEWLELQCEMAVDVDLSGWRISGGIDYVFPEGTIIDGGGQVVVALDPSHPTFSQIEALGPYTGQLANGGERLELHDSAGRLMDTMSYGDRGEWPVAADGSGATLSKGAPGLRSSRSSSWTFSLNKGGTPGSDNFPDEVPDGEPRGPVFNEIPPAGSEDFFVEMTNPLEEVIDLSGYFLVFDRDEPVIFPLPAVNLESGMLHTMTAEELGVTPDEGDRIYLMPRSLASPSDSKRVTGRLRGRAPGYGEAWLYPAMQTPDSANVFDLETDVVINEICYRPPKSDPLPALPPTIETKDVVALDGVWRFNESGDDLGPNWAEESHAVGGNWRSGPGLLAFDRGIDLPVGTVLRNPTTNNPRVVTYYFETDFELSEEEAEGLLEVVIDAAVDDGAIFYLNGFEIQRIRMPEGPVTADTVASGSVGDASLEGPEALPVPRGLAIAGTNRLSVQVHQSSPNSNDVGFGLIASLNIQTNPGRERQPAEESDNQWLELYNRGTDEIDLSGWDFGEGIGYDFPFGTILGPGEYLVVARMPDELATDHPGARILGPFSGALSRSGETLILRDANKNPADSLRYFDGGRWPELANGRGSTMELRDPHADNSLPGAWASSDELARTSWQNFSYRREAEASKVGPDNQWRDFVFGLHEEGEILIDDLRVVEDPDGAATPFLVDGSFENGNTASWRFLGNHRDAEIVPDPDGGGNVLRLRSTGTTEHMHNHVETTLANGRRVTNGREYEISFRARWLNGDNQLHTRLYFNRLAQTTRLARPDVLGTPGLANLTRVSNLGPTAHSLMHSPPVPSVGQPVRVSLSLRDPDGVASARVFYRVNGGAFSSAPMSQVGQSEEWTASIPGGSSGQIIQFYVEASDGGGATSLVPPGGPESRALIQVDDGRAANTGINNIRIIMDPADRSFLFQSINVMSNDRLPCTVIDREQTIYYDAGVRIKGSQRARLASNRVGFNVGFRRDQLYRGVHRTIAIDRSEGQVVGQRELLFDLMATSSGGIPGEHNDLCYVISPDPRHTSAAILQLARFGAGYLDSQFENGSEGTVYEYELIYYPTTANGQGYKIPQPDSVVGTNVTSLGSNPEDYRWNYLVKNNQENDDFDPILRLTSLFDLPRTEFQEQVDDVLDVDQWLRSLAYACAMGAGDSFFSNSRHNGQFYGRPDGRVLFFPHDNDFQFQTTRPIFQNRELSKLITDPAKRRRYLSHLEDICRTVYNRDWMTRWASHYDVLVPGGSVFGDDLSYIGQRSNYILQEVARQVSRVDFEITTEDGDDFSTPDSPVVLQGTGWVDIDEIRLAGSDGSLPVTWSTTDDWEVPVALSPGENLIVLEAYNFSGERVGTDSITVTSTGSTTVPSVDNLVVSEIFYNPEGASEGAEYLEFMNVSDISTLDLTGMQITDGVQFVFPGGIVLGPGERVLVVSEIGAFESRFGGGLPVAGSFENQLANGGETITLRLADGSLVRSFSYSDDSPWPALADGEGFSLVLADPWVAPDHSVALNWRASAEAGGSPGGAGGLDYEVWKAGFGNPADDEDSEGDGWTVSEEFMFGGSPTTRDQLGPRSHFDLVSGMFTTSVTLRVGAGTAATLQSSADLDRWEEASGSVFLGSTRTVRSGVEVDELSFAVPLGGEGGFYRFFFKLANQP